MTQLSSNPLQTIMDEFKNISPEITNVSLFKKDGEIIASYQTTTEDQVKKTIIAFENIATQAETIGGIETLTIQGANNQLNIISMNNRYLATVSSRIADEKIVNSLTHVLVPTVLELMDQIAHQQSQDDSPKSLSPEDRPTEEVVLPTETIEHNEPIFNSPEIERNEPIHVSPAVEHNEPIHVSPTKFSPEPFLPEAPVTQFMIEKIGGFLVSADTVRIDNEVIEKWSDFSVGRQITRVHIETLDGRKGICKFKPIKKAANHNATGIIQIPEKILQALQISKGKLVMVKPIIT